MKSQRMSGIEKPVCQNLADSGFPFDRTPVRIRSRRHVEGSVLMEAAGNIVSVTAVACHVNLMQQIHADGILIRSVTTGHDKAS